MTADHTQPLKVSQLNFCPREHLFFPKLNRTHFFLFFFFFFNTFHRCGFSLLLFFFPHLSNRSMFYSFQIGLSGISHRPSQHVYCFPNYCTHKLTTSSQAHIAHGKKPLAQYSCQQHTLQAECFVVLHSRSPGEMGSEESTKNSSHF